MKHDVLNDNLQRLAVQVTHQYSVYNIQQRDHYSEFVCITTRLANPCLAPDFPNSLIIDNAYYHGNY